VKALSIQQPWAYCITHATKRIENRTWFGHYRGPLLIHAGKKFQTGMEYDINSECPEIDVYAMQQSDRGAIVGVCRMVTCLRPGEYDKVAPDQRIWTDESTFRFVLDEVRAFAVPIPYKGMLGFFDVPDFVVAEAMAEARNA
jgi:ASCH domain